MGKRANPMAVKAALTYDVNEAAMALGKTPSTIRNWIRDGLPVMASRKPVLISGEAIRDYLRGRREASRRPLQPDHLFCLSCRAGRAALGMTVTISEIGPKTSLLKGRCERCGCTSTRMIANRDVSVFKQAFRIAKELGSTP